MMHKAWCSIEEVPYYFSGSSIKFRGHTGWKIDDSNPIWVVAAIKSLRFALLFHAKFSVVVYMILLQICTQLQRLETYHIWKSYSFPIPKYSWSSLCTNFWFNYYGFMQQGNLRLTVSHPSHWYFNATVYFAAQRLIARFLWMYLCN